MCDKENFYQYHSQAIAAANGLSKRKRRAARVYFCHVHQGYHLTTPKRKKMWPFKFKYKFTVKHWSKKDGQRTNG